MTSHLLLCGVVAAALLSPAAAAQTALWHTTLPGDGRFQTEVGGQEPLRDFDGDGEPDHLLDAAVDLGQGLRAALVVLSGADGTPILSPQPSAARMPVPDLDGDAVADVWMLRGSSTATGFEYALLSGATLGAATADVLTSFPRLGNDSFSTRSDVLAGGLDMVGQTFDTGDGIPDLAGLHAGAVYLFSGFSLANGAQVAYRAVGPPETDADPLLFPVPAEFTPSRSHIALVSDLDGDALADVLVSDSFFSPAVNTFGIVYAFSGATGALIHRIFDGVDRPLNFAYWGLAPLGDADGAPGGDLDGDGTPDLVVASRYSPDADPVHVLSGATGETLREFSVPGTTQFGVNLRAAPDLDGDGTGDVLAWAREPDGDGVDRYSVRVVSSDTGAELWRAEDPTGDAGSGFGLSYLSASRRGNGTVQVVVSAPYADVDGREDAGIVYAFAAVPVAGAPEAERETLSLSASPNPSRGAVTVAFTLAEASSVRVSVVDALGRAVWSEAGPRAAGRQRVAVPVGLAAGVYGVRVEAGDAAATRTVSVVR